MSGMDCHSKFRGIVTFWRWLSKKKRERIPYLPQRKKKDYIRKQLQKMKKNALDQASSLIKEGG